MAAFQVINDPYRSLSASIGAGLGSTAGSGLGGLLEGMAHQKVQNMQNSKLENLLVATGNYTPEEAKLAVAFGQMKGANPLEAAQMFQGGARKPSLQDVINQQVQQDQEPQQLQQRLNSILENRPEALGSLDLANLGNAATLQKGLGNFDIGSLDPQQLLQQAAMQGINLSPDQQQNVINKLQGIQKDKQLRSEFERDLQDYLQRQQQQKVSSQQEEPEKKLFKKPQTAAQKATEQHQIKLENQKELDPLNKMIGLADEGLGILDSVLADLDAGKISTGPLVGNTPISLMSTLYSQETQDAARSLSNYLTLKSGLLKGNPTQYRVKGLEKGKPGLELSEKGLRRAIEEERKPLLALKNLDNIRNKIIEEHGGEEPRNLNYLIKQRANKLGMQEKPMQQSYKVNQIVDQKPKNPNKGFQVLNDKDQIEEWDGNKWIIKG